MLGHARAQVASAVLVAAACSASPPETTSETSGGSSSGVASTSSDTTVVSGDTSASTTGLPTGSSGGVSSGGVSSGGSSADFPEAGCNGSVALCERRYDQVVFPGTHNSVAATRSGFPAINANQTHPVLDQLQDGIRVLLLDVAYDGDETALCHGPCTLASRPHLEVLRELEGFLRGNPGEVVTIIYQDAVDPADVEADFVEADLLDLVYAHDGGAWPTLGEMVAADTRLVVTAEVGGPPPAWYHHVWDLAFDTPYTFTDVDAFSCALNRGQPDNDLFLVNHWLSTEAGLPDASAAPTANAMEVLMQRVSDCEAATGRRPTFIAVDFYEQGDLFAVVEALNG